MKTLKSSRILFFCLIPILFVPSSVRAEDIRDVKPPLDLPINYFFLFLLLTIIAVVLIALGIRSIFQRLKKKQLMITIPQSAWEVALDRLENLKKANWPAQGKIKEYYSSLSDIERRYIEDRYRIKAPEMTTEEFLWNLKNFPQLNAVQKDSLKEFLNSCDMVKFAKYAPTVQEVEESFRLAQKFIEETKGQKEAIEKGSYGI